MSPHNTVSLVQLGLEVSETPASSSARLSDLFEHAPVCLLEEDYSRVVPSLIQLNDAGIADLESYLLEHRDLLIRLIQDVEITDANPAALALFGLQECSQLCGPIQVATLNEPAMVAFAQQFHALAGGAIAWESSFRGSDMDGDELPVRLTLHVPRADGKPDFRHVMVAMTDVSELMNTQRKLEHLIRWKDQFTAAAAHELRTPLTGIVGFLEVLRQQDEVLDGISVRDVLDVVADEANELQRLVEDLLVAARSEVGDLHVQTSGIDLRPLVCDALKLVDGQTQTIGENVRVAADGVRVRQIVRNLVTNAIRYGGPVRRVAVGRLDGMAHLDVADNGPEIPAETATSIFDPFVRGADNTLHTSVGLGLSIARSLAQAQGGDLFYLRIGDENVFRLVLPLA